MLKYVASRYWNKATVFIKEPIWKAPPQKTLFKFKDASALEQWQLATNADNSTTRLSVNGEGVCRFEGKIETTSENSDIPATGFCLMRYTVPVMYSYFVEYLDLKKYSFLEIRGRTDDPSGYDSYMLTFHSIASFSVHPRPMQYRWKPSYKMESHIIPLAKFTEGSNSEGSLISALSNKWTNITNFSIVRSATANTEFALEITSIRLLNEDDGAQMIAENNRKKRIPKLSAHIIA